MYVVYLPECIGTSVLISRTVKRIQETPVFAETRLQRAELCICFNSGVSYPNTIVELEMFRSGKLAWTCYLDSP